MASSSPAREVAVGDIVLLKLGKAIAADGRVLHTIKQRVQVDESKITGESLAQDRQSTG